MIGSCLHASVANVLHSVTPWSVLLLDELQIIAKNIIDFLALRISLYGYVTVYHKYFVLKVETGLTGMKFKVIAIASASKKTFI